MPPLLGVSFYVALMLKSIIPILLILAQTPSALAYSDFKETDRVVLFGFPKKAKFTITYGDLKFFRSTKLVVDKCGTVILKGSKFSRFSRFGYFRDAEDYIIEGDNKTSINVNMKKSVLLAQQAAINWDSVESTRLRYTCLDGVINPNLAPIWIDKNGIKFFLSGKPDSQSEKLYISGIPYSTVKLKTLQELDAKPVTRKVSSDNCGAISIRDNWKYPNNLLGQFTITERGGAYQVWSYDSATIPEATSRDPIKCDRYQF
jgi:hypothetical protein